MSTDVVIIGGFIPARLYYGKIDNDRFVMLRPAASGEEINIDHAVIDLISSKVSSFSSMLATEPNCIPTILHVDLPFRSPSTLVYFPDRREVYALRGGSPFLIVEKRGITEMPYHVMQYYSSERKGERRHFTVVPSELYSSLVEMLNMLSRGEMPPPYLQNRVASFLSRCNEYPTIFYDLSPNVLSISLDGANTRLEFIRNRNFPFDFFYIDVPRRRGAIHVGFIPFEGYISISFPELERGAWIPELTNILDLLGEETTLRSPAPDLVSYMVSGEGKLNISRLLSNFPQEGAKGEKVLFIPLPESYASELLPSTYLNKELYNYLNEILERFREGKEFLVCRRLIPPKKEERYREYVDVIAFPIVPPDVLDRMLTPLTNLLTLIEDDNTRYDLLIHKVTFPDVRGNYTCWIVSGFSGRSVYGLDKHGRDYKNLKITHVLFPSLLIAPSYWGNRDLLFFMSKLFDRVKY